MTAREKWAALALGALAMAAFIAWALVNPRGAANLATVLVIMLAGGTLCAVAILSFEDGAQRARRDREWEIPADWDEVTR